MAVTKTLVKGIAEKDPRDPSETLYAEERLLALYGGVAAHPARQQVEAALESVERFANGAMQADDMAILTLRYSPGDGECPERRRGQARSHKVRSGTGL